MLLSWWVVSAQEKSPPLRAWGLEAMQQNETQFWLPERGLYADEATPGQPPPDKPAFMWGGGVQLTALTAAAKVDKAKYAPLLKRYADGLQVYWTETNGIGGYDVLPAPKPPDRYYDDNEWIVLAFCEAYAVTGDALYRDRAEKTLAFVMSGEDDKLGGGIYWREPERTSKNTCSNGPAAAAALRLYQLTKKSDYLAIGRRLYDWTNAHLQDTDGLYFDNVKLDGTVEKTKWSYNTALMLRANCLLYEITQEKRYLAEAERIAKAAEARWIKPDTGGVADDAQFAHLLLEAFLSLHALDGDAHWREIVVRALTYLHDKARDPKGYYPARWDTPLSTALTKVTLIKQASAARAFLVAADGLP